MCDEKDRADVGRGHSDGRGASTFRGCGAMMKQMVRTFREAVREAPDSEPAADAGDEAGSTAPTEHRGCGCRS